MNILQLYDLVIPLGTGSIWQDNEVRYCVRSFSKYFKQLGKIYIVGAKPDFFKWHHPRLVHIQCSNPFTSNKDANIIHRVLEACKYVSFDFIRCSDDQVLLQNLIIDDFRPKYLGDLSTIHWNSAANNWKKRLKHTYEVLKKEGKTTFHYDSHYPMIYNRDSFKEIMKKYPSDNRNGYTINTLYFNNILDEHEKIGNIKVTLEKPIMDMQGMLEISRGKKFLGYRNKGLRDGVLKQFIQNMFPEKCEFEI